MGLGAPCPYGPESACALLKPTCTDVQCLGIPANVLAALEMFSIMG